MKIGEKNKSWSNTLNSIQKSDAETIAMAK
jgi:hypothetical protein